MAFLLECPHCGSRPVTEFAYAGEIPAPAENQTSARSHTYELYRQDNAAGVQREWWFHRFGCERWLVGERDTRTNRMRWLRTLDEADVPVGGAGWAAAGAPGARHPVHGPGDARGEGGG